MACGARVNSVSSTPGLKLSSYQTVFLTLRSSGGISVNTSSLGSIETTQVMDAEAAAAQALVNFQFRLMGLGFSVVDNSSAAGAVFDLSLGAIRYDPIGGWIADKAILSVRDRATGQIVKMYSTEGRFITASVDKLVSMLAEAVADDY
jgi:hypothetical protein